MSSVMTSTNGTWRGFPKSRTLSTLLVSDHPAMADAIASDIETVFDHAPARLDLDKDAAAQISGDHDLIFLQCDRQILAGLVLLSSLAQRPITERPAVIVQCTLETLDDLFIFAETLEADILIGPDTAERIVTLTALARRTGLREGNDNTPQKLRELSEQIADFSEKITRLGKVIDKAAWDKNIDAEAGDPSQNVEKARTAPPSHRPDHVGVGDSVITAAEVRQLIAQRRLRDRLFEGDLFADPAWDILLDLYASHLENISISVSSLCIAAAVPPTTALRWVSLMTRHGILQRRPDSEDKRRVYIELSEQAIAAMTAFFTEQRDRNSAEGGAFLPGL
ncbi:MAG: hypothetical protein AAGH53_03415 [Pseudomonadota bacterium]